MSVKHIQDQLADAFSLLDMSLKVLDNLDSISLARLDATLTFVKKNIRDALDLINRSEAELDDIVREIDDHEIDIDEEVF